MSDYQERIAKALDQIRVGVWVLVAYEVLPALGDLLAFILN